MTDLDLEAARAGDADAFARLVGAHRRELLAHCYRMLGSTPDAEDAVQEALLAAWRGLASFEGRSSLRTWLYRITTHVCLRQARRRPPRVLSWEVGPARTDPHDLGAPVDAPFLDPWLGDGVEAPGESSSLYLKNCGPSTSPPSPTCRPPSAPSSSSGRCWPCRRPRWPTCSTPPRHR